MPRKTKSSNPWPLKGTILVEEKGTVTEEQFEAALEKSQPKEPRKVNVQIGFEVEVTISPDADEYTIAKLNELKRAMKDAVENEIRDHFNRGIGDPEVDLGVPFGFKIVNRWY